MDKRAFIELLENRGKGSAAAMDELQRMVEKYPYFTAARLLLLKSLQENEQLSFALELKRTAAHIASRERLFEWVSRPLAQKETTSSSEVVVEKTEEETDTVTRVSPSEDQHEKASSQEESKNEDSASITPRTVSDTPASEHAGDKAEPESEEKPSRIEARPIPDWVNDPAAAARQRVKELLAKKRKSPSTSDISETGAENNNDSETSESPTPAPSPTSAPRRLVDIENIVSEESGDADSVAEAGDLPTPDPSKDAAEDSKEIQSESLASTTVENDTEGAIDEQDIIDERSAADDESEVSSIDFIPDEIEEAKLEKERHSLSDWLSQLSNESVERVQPDLIDRFLKHPPSFRPKKTQKTEGIQDISKDSLRENPEIMTETLARLYTEQGHYAKAIEAYEILSLRFPEKSSFFAGRAKELKKRLKDRK